jgi:hypothetical protein
MTSLPRPRRCAAVVLRVESRTPLGPKEGGRGVTETPPRPDQRPAPGRRVDEVRPAAPGRTQRAEPMPLPPVRAVKPPPPYLLAAPEERRHTPVADQAADSVATALAVAETE